MVKLLLWVRVSVRVRVGLGLLLVSIRDRTPVCVCNSAPETTGALHFLVIRLFRAQRPVYSDTTQLNSTDPVEQRTANQREASQSCF